jgi:zinc protease
LAGRVVVFQIQQSPAAARPETCRVMIPAVQKGSIGGVTVLRSDSDTGRNAASLVFRVGRFDETLPTAGITHLIEHFTLSSKPRASYKFNAEVGGRFTAFFMESADPADTADFIATVCRGLAADHGGALEHGKRMLRTEAMSRGGAGALGACLGERYGATGPGLSAYEEYGLNRLGWPEIEAWRRRWFVAGNAVLWIQGTIPRELRIDLPPGQAPAATALRAVDLVLPGVVLAGRGGIGMSLAGPRSDAIAVTLDILQERLTRVLRQEHGLSHGVRGIREDLDGDLSHAWLVADAIPEQTAQVGHSTLTAFESLAEDGGTDGEVEDYVQRLRSAYEAPDGPAMVMHRQAQDILSGRRPRAAAETLMAVGEVDRKAVSEAAYQLLGQMIVATPQPVPAVQSRMPRLPLWSATPITGTRVKAPDSGSSLTVSDQGVMLTAELGHHVTVRSGGVAALFCWNDKKRTLVGTDGFAVQLDPAEWPDGENLVHSIEDRIDPSLIVSIDSPGPSRQKQEPPPPVAVVRPTAVAVEKVTSWPSWNARIIRALGIAAVIVGILSMSGGDVTVGIAFALVGILGLAWQQLVIWRRVRRPGHPGSAG